MTYQSFLKSKAITAPAVGFEPCEDLLPTQLFDFQRDCVKWASRRGRAALFEDCGLGKTPQQLAWADQVSSQDHNVLILAPLCVTQQTVKEGQKFGITVHPCNEQADVQCGINITNYEKLHRFVPEAFGGIVLDESSILKSYDGKTRTQIIESFVRTPYKLACTATPAPNDFMELGNHAEFLGVMSRVEMLATFFVHDGGDTSKWRLKGHAESEFWKWLCSWAVNIRKPSDLGYADGGFQLPPLNLIEHVVESKQAMTGYLFTLPASTLAERRDARRASIGDRVSECCGLINTEKWAIWCELNDEQDELEKAFGKNCVSIRGTTSDEDRIKFEREWREGSIQILISKPSIFGFGMNWQHCQNVVFLGISDSYETFYQAVRRFWRFGQTKPVNAHIIISELEGAVLANIKRKEADARRLADEMIRHMADISSVAIKGSVRETEEYNPRKKMKLPAFI
jgi:hypothetical protein